MEVKIIPFHDASLLPHLTLSSCQICIYTKRWISMKTQFKKMFHVLTIMTSMLELSGKRNKALNTAKMLKHHFFFFFFLREEVSVSTVTERWKKCGGNTCLMIRKTFFYFETGVLRIELSLASSFSAVVIEMLPKIQF